MRFNVCVCQIYKAMGQARPRRTVRANPAHLPRVDVPHEPFDAILQQQLADLPCHQGGDDGDGQVFYYARVAGAPAAARGADEELDERWTDEDLSLIHI